MKKYFSHLFVIFMAHLVLAVSTQASVVASGTRFIYRSTDKQVSIHLNNAGDHPALVQAWIDDGDSKITPDKVKVPFLLSPSLARLDPGRGQTLRLIHTGEALPQDRESVFWLNIHEVAPKANLAPGTNSLQFAVRTRLKVFYRPAALKEEVTAAAAKLTWKPAPDADSATYTVSNPTPYYISIGDIHLHAGGAKSSKPLFTMIAPMGQETLKFERLKDDSAKNTVTSVNYKVIDDLGGTRDAVFSLEPAKK